MWKLVGSNELFSEVAIKIKIAMMKTNLRQEKKFRLIVTTFQLFSFSQNQTFSSSYFAIVLLFKKSSDKMLDQNHPTQRHPY